MRHFQLLTKKKTAEIYLCDSRCKQTLSPVSSPPSVDAILQKGLFPYPAQLLTQNPTLHLIFVDVVAVPLNMADTMGIQITTSFPH